MPHLPVHAPYLARVRTMHLSIQRTPAVTRCTHLIPFIVHGTRGCLQMPAKRLQSACKRPATTLPSTAHASQCARARQIKGVFYNIACGEQQCTYNVRSLGRPVAWQTSRTCATTSRTVPSRGESIKATSRRSQIPHGMVLCTAWYHAACYPTRHSIPRSADLLAASRPGGRDGADVLCAPQHQHVRPLRRWLLRRTNRPAHSATQSSAAHNMLQSATSARARRAWHPTRHGILWAALHRVTMLRDATRSKHAMLHGTLL